jgi:hypothetical protein
MQSKNRKFGVFRVTDYRENSILELAITLTQRTQTKCQGYRIKKYILLNDTPEGESAQQYGLFIEGVEEGTYQQTQCIHFGYASTELAEHWLDQMARGVYEIGELEKPMKLELSDIKIHGSCKHCD